MKKQKAERELVFSSPELKISKDADAILRQEFSDVHPDLDLQAEYRKMRTFLASYGLEVSNPEDFALGWMAMRPDPLAQGLIDEYISECPRNPPEPKTGFLM